MTPFRRAQAAHVVRAKSIQIEIQVVVGAIVRVFLIHRQVSVVVFAVADFHSDTDSTSKAIHHIHADLEPTDLTALGQLGAHTVMDRTVLAARGCVCHAARFRPGAVRFAVGGGFTLFFAADIVTARLRSTVSSAGAGGFRRVFTRVVATDGCTVRVVDLTVAVMAAAVKIHLAHVNGCASEDRVADTLQAGVDGLALPIGFAVACISLAVSIRVCLGCVLDQGAVVVHIRNIVIIVICVHAVGLAVLVRIRVTFVYLPVQVVVRTIAMLREAGAASQGLYAVDAGLGPCRRAATGICLADAGRDRCITASLAIMQLAAGPLVVAVVGARCVALVPGHTAIIVAAHLLAAILGTVAGGLDGSLAHLVAAGSGAVCIIGPQVSFVAALVVVDNSYVHPRTPQVALTRIGSAGVIVVAINVLFALTDITDLVAVEVRLIRIRNERAVVLQVRHRVAVVVFVARVALFVAVGVDLVGVRVQRTDVIHVEHPVRIVVIVQRVHGPVLIRIRTALVDLFVAVVVFGIALLGTGGLALTNHQPGIACHHSGAGAPLIAVHAVAEVETIVDLAIAVVVFAVTDFVVRTFQRIAFLNYAVHAVVHCVQTRSDPAVSRAQPFVDAACTVVIDTIADLALVRVDRGRGIIAIRVA